MTTQPRYTSKQYRDYLAGDSGLPIAGTVARYVIPFPPSVNGAYRLIPVKSGGVRRVKGKKHAEWEVTAQACVSIQRQRQPKIAGRYKIAFTFARPKDGHRHDLGNLEKAPHDVLVRMGIVLDDSLAEEITLRWGDVNGCQIQLEAI